MKKGIFLVFAFLFLCGISLGQTKSKHPVLKKNLSCNLCHICKTPTIENPCLIPCPREKIAKAKFKLKDAPREILIDPLEKKYYGVDFPHYLHAQMAVMSGGCGTCHHYNTTTLEILSCDNCHSKERKRADVSKPDLKGAYHQLCITCHRAWSRKTECVSCHLPKGEKPVKKTYPKEHPKIAKPDKVIFKTLNDDGPVVTFYHKDHNELYGFTNCSTCHKDETCIACHDVSKKDIVTRSDGGRVKTIVQKEENGHALCGKCHDTEDFSKCNDCHKKEEAAPFNHKKVTGWALGKFHSNLKCIACHGYAKQFSKQNKDCSACHSKWNPDNFNHAVTGLKLDENHSGNDCESCHPDRQFNKTPVCSDCHDKKSFPKDVPGKYLKRSAGKKWH